VTETSAIKFIQTYPSIIFGLTVQTLYKPLCKQPPLFLEKGSAACLPLQRFGGFNSRVKLLLVVFIASMALKICLLYISESDRSCNFINISTI
jgi:hypothetical protein